MGFSTSSFIYFFFSTTILSKDSIHITHTPFLEHSQFVSSHSKSMTVNLKIVHMIKFHTYFQAKRNKKRETTTNKTAPITGPTIINISMSFLFTLSRSVVSIVGENGFGLSGSFPYGAGRMSREMYSEKGDDVYRCC